MFSDFQCPFCSRVEPTLDQVKTHLRSRQGPHRLEEPAAAVPRQGEARRRGRADASSRSRAPRRSGSSTTPRSRTRRSSRPRATRSGPSPRASTSPKFKAGLATHKAAKKVEEDSRSRKKVGANGTPAFRINGVELSGAQPFDKFKEVDRQGARQGRGEDRGGHAEGQDLRRDVARRTSRPLPPRRAKKRARRKTRRPSGSVPVGNSPDPRQGRRARHDRRVLRLPVPVLQARRAARSRRSRRPTATRSASSGSTSRSRSTRAPSRPRSSRSRRAPQKGDKGFWDAHDKLFDVQPKLEDADLEKVAAGARPRRRPR